MTITASQRITISQLWNRVCKDRGWKPSDRALRLDLLGKMVGRPLTSMDEIGRLEECTQVMAELKALLGVDLNAGLEATDPARGRKRNSRWLIENEVLPCLAVYPLEAPMGRSGAAAFLQKILVDKSRWRQTDRPETAPDLGDFDARTVTQILWTLSARLSVKRKEAGHTGHQMRIAAGVRCECAMFCRGKLGVPIGAETAAEIAPETEAVAQPNWSV